MTRKNKKEKGFTLIEVLVGLVILAIGMLSIAAMQITSIKGGSFSNHLTQATTYAQDRLENLKNRPYNDAALTSGHHDDGTIATIFLRQYDVVEDAGNLLKTITVTVQWTDKSNHSVSFRVIRTN